MFVEMILLRTVHVLGAIMWGGTSIFVAVFLMPALGTLGPAAGQVMAALVKRRLFTVIPIVAVLMMLAGLRMMMLVSNGFSSAYFQTRPGISYSVGALCGVGAFALFMLVSHPAITKVLALGARMAQATDAEKAALGAEMAAVRARAGMASVGNATLLTVAAIAMAIGRYL